MQAPQTPAVSSSQPGAGPEGSDHPHPRGGGSPSRPASPGKESGWTLLGYDVRHWAHGHMFGIVTTAVFILLNITRWVYRAIRHLGSGPNALSTDFAKMMVKRRISMSGMHRELDVSSPSLPSQICNLAGSLVFVSGILTLLFNAALMLLILSVAQSRLGVARTVVVSVGSAVLGTAIGLLLCVAANMYLNNWQWVQRIPVSLSPLIVMVGALMAASAYESILWRRRILLIGYTAISALLLFSGNPGDYCALAAAVVGHVTGRVMHGKPTEHIAWWKGTDYEIRRLFAAAQFVLAIGPILALTSHSHAGPLTGLGLFTAPDFGSSTLLNVCLSSRSARSCMILAAGAKNLTAVSLWFGVLLPVAALAVVAWGVYRGKRLAAWTSIILNSTTVIFAALYYLVFPLVIDADNPALVGRYGFTPAFIATALPPLALVVLLVKSLPHFSVRASRISVRTGIAAIVVALLGTSAGYLLFGSLFPRDFVPRASIARLLRDLPRRFLPMGFAGRTGSLIRPRTVFSIMVTQGAGIIFWMCVLIVFVLWFQDSLKSDGYGRARASQLVQVGGESMSFMTTWEGNRYWFSPTGRSAIAYRVLHGVALTVTGPFGDPREYMTSLREFIRFCDAHSWSPAFYAVHEEQRQELEDLGCSSIQVGTEMLVAPSTWQTRGKKWQDIRTAINKAKRDGVTDVFTTYDAAGWNVQQQIVGISEQWAELKSLPEMKFTLGGIEELTDPRVALLYAQDGDGKILGVTSWLPTYQEGRVIGWTLDFMRHRTDSPNGVMEFLIARMAERLRDQGQEDPDHAVTFMSLSAAPLAGLSPDGQDSAMITHALQIVADTLEPAYAFKSLYFFKRKFQPIPSPIYICYPDSAKLAQIGLAVTGAYLPELTPSQILDMLKSLRPNDDK